jgi:phosphocarrier protein FPr
VTVGIVLVSHSARLAEAAAELAHEVASQGLRLALAGGVDDPDHPLGTDAMRVVAAIDEVYTDDGVLVLMDLGSAVLSAELALELLPQERRDRVLLSEAPLVEGLVAAAVQAAAGADLGHVAREARTALAPKAAHLETPHAAEAPTDEVDSSAENEATVVTARVVLANALGLHARPAARIVETVAGYQAEVTIEDASTGAGPVSAHSLNAVITLGALCGHQLILRATGHDAEQAIQALRTLVVSDFGEPPAASTSPSAPTAQAGRFLQGLPAAPGVAVGTVQRLGAPALTELPSETVENPQAERDRLKQALADAAATINAARITLVARGGEEAGGILQAHRLLLDDPMLVVPAMEAITAQRLPAGAAWARAVADVVAEYRTLTDPYLAARAADVEAIGTEVLAYLSDVGHDAVQCSGIVIAADISPAQAARLDPARVDAILTAGGSPTSHAVIIARHLGIPAVVGAGPAVLALPHGTCLVVDGDAGRVEVNPEPAALAAAERAIRERAMAEEADRQRAAVPSATSDGTAIEVLANVGLLAEATRARAEGAGGVGLLRTELLFLDRLTPPDEEEQVTAYQQICEALEGRPVVLRTFDVGGDKPLPYLDLPEEANPFLGARAIRLGLGRPALLTTQLRAALRVAADRPLRLMIPMVSTLEEVHSVRGLLHDARQALSCEGVAVPDRIDLGVMVEVPALALKARHVAAAVDFLSIGTNDLTQYAMAAERGNRAVAHLVDPLDPAVVRLIAMVCDAASDAHVPVAVCGDMAADATAVPLLLGLGVREFSVPPPAIPRIKQRVRATDLDQATRLARKALEASSAAEVRRLLLANRPHSSE